MSEQTLFDFAGGRVVMVAEIDDAAGVVAAVRVENNSDQPARVSLIRNAGDTINRLVPAGVTFRRVLATPVGIDRGEAIAAASRLSMAWPSD